MQSVTRAALIVGAALWCVEALRRLPRDLRELRAGACTSGERTVMFAIWALTVGIAIWLAQALWAILAPLLGALPD